MMSLHHDEFLVPTFLFSFIINNTCPCQIKLVNDSILSYLPLFDMLEISTSGPSIYKP